MNGEKNLERKETNFGAEVRSKWVKLGLQAS
jgi:hypothetical protein